jgi:RNase P/RNase MRP subunit POP5
MKFRTKQKPSAKIHRRYLLLDARSKKQVERVILDYVGILGWARAAPLFIERTKKLVLAVDRKEITNIRAAFEISKEKIKILKVSGTLKGLGRNI